MSDASKLPRWQSHKVVEADKITGVSDGEGLILFRWHLACGMVIEVDEDLARRVTKGGQAVGGYYVRYLDGYQSWSPADAFEGGYAAIKEDE